MILTSKTGCTTLKSSSPSPWYTTTGGIEQSIEQNGLTIAGLHHATLYVGCTGQGYPGPQMVNPKFGVEQASYKQFLCSIQLSGSTVNLIHVQTGNAHSYTWQQVG